MLHGGQLYHSSQTGGQWYSDTSPFSIPWLNDQSDNVIKGFRASDDRVQRHSGIPGVDVIKLFSSSLTNIPNKLEHLSEHAFLAQSNWCW